MKSRLLFIALITLCTFSQCSKEKAPTPPPPSGEDEEITIDVPDLTLPDDNAQSTLTFSSSAAWTISLSETKGVEEWLTVEPMSGAAGQATVTVTAEPNENYDDRSAVIRIRSGSTSKSLRVYQKKKNALLLSKERYELSCEETSIDVKVKSNIDFEVKILDDWITQIQTKGLVIYPLSFAVQPNDAQKRTGKIVFLDRNSSLSDTVYIEQTGKEEIQQDREALIALYNATGGNNWTHNDNWCSDKPINEWYGVTTNYTTGRVSEISLPENNLSGSLPDEIKQLTALQILNLDLNNFTEIPAVIGEIQSLEHLSMNSNTSPGSPLSGNIPSSLGNLSNLKYLFLCGDFGPLPEELGALTQLENLAIVGAWYGRSISEPIPDWIQNLKKLTHLSLGGMKLSGDIPNWIYNLSELQELHLECNALTGIISENISNLKSLTYITLNNNKLSGTIPSSLTLLTNLQHCYLNDNDLEGTLPEGFATLTNLLTLHTYGNRMSGQIPEDFKQNPNFESWGVAQNILPQQPGYTLSLGSSYESSDYSADGEVMTLQTATQGKGVDIVLLGDGFVDRDMDSGGKYEQAMQEAYEYLFALEPMKSYREYFNVYAVKAVSKHEQFGYGNETALSATFGGDGVYVSGNDDKCFEYAQKAPIHSVDQVTIAVALNISAYAGTTFWHGQDAAVAYIGMHRPVDGFYEKTFEATFIHEVVGHGVGKLADEYVYNNEYFPPEFIEHENELYQTYGWNANISYSSDPEQVRWKHMLSDPRYSSYTGLVEGGNLYAHGVWRPEEYSMMNISCAYFNAPSREAIVKRIKRLAGETYSFEEFAAKDKYEPITNTKSAPRISNTIQLPSPVIIRK
ncbi:BACON domain-containing protein [Millionella massiliensis]|uniref:BACON domain-containing protein n=1 Tax=Millionella massiliensis TaxID=1871023 RepID=UPI0013564D34|nr:M64 family metallopeptidase [Millionella massiliensis]